MKRNTPRTRKRPRETEWRRVCRLAKIKSGVPWTVGQMRAMNRLLNDRYAAGYQKPKETDPAVKQRLIDALGGVL